MKKITILMVAIMSLLSVCLGLTACGKDKKDNVVRVSEVTHSLFYAPLYIAMNNGGGSLSSVNAFLNMNFGMDFTKS